MQFLSKFLLLFILSALFNPSAEAMKRKAVDAAEDNGSERRVRPRADGTLASHSDLSNGHASNDSDLKDAKQVDGKEAKKEEPSVEGPITVLNSDVRSQSLSSFGNRQAARKNVFDMLQSRSIGELKNP